MTHDLLHIEYTLHITHREDVSVVTLTRLEDSPVMYETVKRTPAAEERSAV
jgi:hypothetical protein